MQQFIVSLALVSTLSCTSLQSPRAPRDDESSLSVLTYNVNFGVRPTHESETLLRSFDADVILIQESTKAWANFFKDELGEEYAYQKFVERRAAGGLSLLSRYPLRDYEVLETPSGWFDAQRALIETEVGGVQFLNVHLHPPVSEEGSLLKGVFTTDAVRLKELDSFRERLQKDMPTIIAGDFNEGSGDATASLKRDGFDCALEGFVANAMTWRWDLGVVEVRQNLDHIFASKQLRAIDAKVVHEGASDHFPVSAQFVFERM